MMASAVFPLVWRAWRAAAAPGSHAAGEECSQWGGCQSCWGFFVARHGKLLQVTSGIIITFRVFSPVPRIRCPPGLGVFILEDWIEEVKAGDLLLVSSVDMDAVVTLTARLPLPERPQSSPWSCRR